jgi:uncharacterized protein YcbK (DUF882 family)
MTWNYFKPEEVQGLDPELVSKLDTARHAAGIPFSISSGLRSSSGNSILKGAVPDSAHLTGKAVDLRVGNNHDFFLMMKSLMDAGFNRIGVYLNTDCCDVIHLHVDIDADKPQETIWPKKEQN